MRDFRVRVLQYYTNWMFWSVFNSRCVPTWHSNFQNAWKITANLAKVSKMPKIEVFYCAVAQLAREHCSNLLFFLINQIAFISKKLKLKHWQHRSAVTLRTFLPCFSSFEFFLEFFSLSFDLSFFFNLTFEKNLGFYSEIHEVLQSDLLFSRN